ncbi:MAG TPA: RDD family protein [Actinomycetota bacterium]|nr:RDD family protein [Actinomycetota bacterium]
MTDPGGTTPPGGAPPPPPAAPPPGVTDTYNRKKDSQGRPLAEWWKRVVAYIIDSVVVGIPAWILAGIFSIGAESAIEVDPTTGQITGGGGFLAAYMGSILLTWALGVAYYVYFNGGEKGQTVGKMAMKIAVRDEATGGPIGYGKAAVRYLVIIALSIPCGIPLLVDFLFPLWDDKRQTIHDKAANSLVVEVG